FTPKHLEHCDAVLAMYHDQGLPVLKYKGFGAAVNVTLGLPIIRTSVDHGTALDLAGTGNIDTGSLRVALATAYLMADSRSSCKRSGALTPLFRQAISPVKLRAFRFAQSASGTPSCPTTNTAPASASARTSCMTWEGSTASCAPSVHAPANGWWKSVRVRAR